MSHSCREEYLNFLMNICYNVPLQVYGSRDGTFFFAGSHNGISIDAEYKSSLYYHEVERYFSRLKPLMLSYNIFNKISFYMSGSRIGVWERPAGKLQ